MTRLTLVGSSRRRKVWQVKDEELDALMEFFHYLHRHSMHKTMTLAEARAFQCELGVQLDNFWKGVFGCERGKDLPSKVD